MRTITNLLQDNASLYPDKTAFEYLSAAGIAEGSYSFKRLNELVQTAAARLQAVARPGDRVALLFPSGIEFIAAFLGTLHAGMIAVPLYLPRKNKMAERVRLVLKDCAPAVLFTNEKSAVYIQKNFSRLTENPADPFLTWESVSRVSMNAYRPVTIAGNTLAFLQYTSGSTGNPKGVKVSHQNLLANLHDLFHNTDQSHESVMASWLPVFHDLGLITGILLPVYAGFTCYLMSPVSFITKPLSWLKLIAGKQATHAVAPNFAFDLCTEAARAPGFQPMDLRSLRYMGNCAEPVRWETMRDFIDLFSTCGLSASVMNPGYGLAEATLKVTAVPPGRGIKKLVVDAQELEANRVSLSREPGQRSKTMVSCGVADHSTTILIMDTATGRICDDIEIGEICIHGPSVTSGYWNDEIKASELFVFPGNKSAAFLKTGDAGFIYEGELYITSRLKDLLIFNGTNHYPQDIEWTVANADGRIKKDAIAAFSVECSGIEKLVVAAELYNENSYSPEAEPGILYNRISEAIASNHELIPYAVIVVRRMTIPKTSSGKIQRSACREQFLNGTLDILHQYYSGTLNSVRAVPQPAHPAATDPFYSVIKALVEKVLGIPDIAPDKNFYELGIDSIRAIQLMHAIGEELSTDIPSSLIFEVKNLHELAERIREFNLPVAGSPAETGEDSIDNLTEAELDSLLVQMFKQDAYRVKNGIDENE